MQVSAGTWKGRSSNSFIPVHKVSRLRRDPGVQSNSLEQVDGHQGYKNKAPSEGSAITW